MFKAKDIVKMVEKAKEQKPRLSLQTLVKGHVELHGYKPKQDRDVSLIKFQAMAGMGWIRFDGESTGESDPYDVTMIFYDVDFSDKKDAAHPIAVSIKQKGRETLYRFMEKLKVAHHPVAVFCACSSFHYRWEWWLAKIGGLAQGHKPRPYTKKPGSTRKPINPDQIKGMCKHLYRMAHEIYQQGYMDKELV